MNIRRRKGLEKEIMRIIFSSILMDIENEKIKNLVSIKSVTLSNDGRYADIMASILNVNENINKDKILEDLDRLKGFFRKKLSDNLEIRHTPELRFHLDDTIEYSVKISKLLNEVNKEKVGD